MLDFEPCMHTWFLGVSAEEDAHWVCLSEIRCRPHFCFEFSMLICSY